jgi:Uma2 family endonuclease
MSTVLERDSEVQIDTGHLERLGPEANGAYLSPEEFDAVVDWDPAYRYELIRGVVIVNPIPLESEADLNEELGRWLRNWQSEHPQGKVLDKTLPERYVYLGDGSRRRADRLLWIGLGRRPRPRVDMPAVVIEFVSKRKRDWRRDYVDKRREYLERGVLQYWVIDRFRREMTVYTAETTRTLKEHETYTTDLLPGFELPHARLFAVAGDWDSE